MIGIPTKQKELSEIKTIKEISGIYFLYDRNKELLYIGQSKNLRTRLHSHFNGTSHLKDKKNAIHSFSVLYAKIEELTELEKNFILKYQPKINQQFINPSDGEYHGVWLDVDIANFIDRIPKGRRSRIINKILRKYLTDNELLSRRTKWR